MSGADAPSPITNDAQTGRGIREARFTWISGLLGWLALGFALLFTLNAGRLWPIRSGSGFPKPTITSLGMLPSFAGSAEAFVYSPDARTMRLDVSVFPEVQAAASTLLVAVGDSVLATNLTAGSSSDPRILSATAPVQFRAGINRVVLGLDPSTGDGRFCVTKISLTQDLLTRRNLLFLAVFLALVAGSILGARAVSSGGLEAFVLAALIGFLVISGCGTLLSYFGQFTAGNMAVAVAGCSAVISGMAVRRGKGLPGVPGHEVLVLLALSAPLFVAQMVLPIGNWDDLMYHGSRAGYWMTNASALPFVSHNDRLSVFPIGGDMLFAFGTLISRSELPGKFLVFMAFPVLLASMLLVLKGAGVRSWAALWIVAVFATTPMVCLNAIGIKPDLWLAAWMVLTLHGVLVAARSKNRALTACILAGAAAGAAMGVKWTAAPLVLLFAVPLWKTAHRKARLLAVGLAFVGAIAIGGSGPILISNLRQCHHPFGSEQMRQHQQPPPGLHVTAVHLKRLPFILFTLPLLPDQEARSLQKWIGAAAERIGATERLQREGEGEWPGVFAPLAETGFSLAWACVVMAGFGGVVLWRKPDREGRQLFLVGLGLSVVFTLAIVTQIRWQTSAGLPQRFLVPALAVGILATGWPLQRFLDRGLAAGVVLLAFLAVHCAPFLLLAENRVRSVARAGWKAPVNAGTGSELEPVSGQLRPGQKILFLGAQGSLDYPLFLAREEFANRIVPWGKEPYGKEAFERALLAPGLGAVLISSCEKIEMDWDPDIDAGPFIRDLEARSEFRRVPSAGGAALFIRP